MPKMHVEKGRIESITNTDKQAILNYVEWVSEDLENIVYTAFESILKIVEVVTATANKKVELGYHAEAELLECRKDGYRSPLQNW